MVKKPDLSGYFILALAITVSLAWHIFWLSAVKIVSSTGASQPVRFSKVSFLGPILSAVGTEVSAQPAELSYLEKRFISYVGDPSSYAGITGQIPEARGPCPAASAGTVDDRMAYYIDKAVSGDKAEPDLKVE
jgi:hypothetical protein